MVYKLDFHTSYNQFYITDKFSTGKTDSNNFWTDEAYNQRLAIEDGILGIGTESYGHIKGELHLLKAMIKSFDYNDYDHIVEGGLEIKSGVLQVIDCPNSAIELELNISQGKYRVRIYSSNLINVDIDEDDGNDFYKIEIWPDSNMERKILKQYFR